MVSSEVKINEMRSFRARKLAELMASDQLCSPSSTCASAANSTNARFPTRLRCRAARSSFALPSWCPIAGCPIVLYDEGDARAPLAAATLLRLGYEQVSILDGGLSAWQAEGRPTVSGVNVPSKAFGEKIHHERNIPDLTPEELKALQERSGNLVILDVRTPEEYGRFCIPGGINVPGGDLILWADELKQKARCDRDRQLRRANPQHHRHGRAAPAGSDQCSRAEKRHDGLGAGRAWSWKKNRARRRRPRRRRVENRRWRWRAQIAVEEKISWISAAATFECAQNTGR